MKASVEDNMGISDNDKQMKRQRNMGMSDNDKQMKRQRRRMEHEDEDEDYDTKAKSEGNIKVWEHKFLP